MDAGWVSHSPEAHRRSPTPMLPTTDRSPVELTGRESRSKAICPLVSISLRHRRALTCYCLPEPVDMYFSSALRLMIGRTIGFGTRMTSPTFTNGHSSRSRSALTGVRVACPSCIDMLNKAQLSGKDQTAWAGTPHEAEIADDPPARRTSALLAGWLNAGPGSRSGMRVHPYTSGMHRSTISTSRHCRSSTSGR
jgi:hypothetical protein